MDSEDRQRIDLASLADDAGTLGFSAERVVERVRRRRRRTSVGGMLGAVAAVGGITVVAAVAWPGGFRGDASTPSLPARSAQPTASSVASSPGGGSGPYVCGEPFRPPGEVASSRAGLSLSALTIERKSSTVGPDLRITFTAQRPITALSSRPSDIAVLYLRDGVIVGGGPLLNPPGDHTGQGTDLMPYPLKVSPGKPVVQALGSRNTLCPGLTWAEVWQQPSRYEVVALLDQPVESTPGAARPPSAVQLLMRRSSLAG